MTGTLKYPRDSLYPNNEHCIWYINIPNPAGGIEIETTEMGIEAGTGCRYDSLKVMCNSNI